MMKLENISCLKHDALWLAGSSPATRTNNINTNSGVMLYMIEYKKEPIIGFEEYQIDTNGIVYNKNGSVKKYSLNHGGYCIVNFYVNHKRTGFAIHTLVAKQFIPNQNDLPQVNHKDGNKQNNCVDNLEWCTAHENIMHSFNVLNRKPARMKEIVGIDKKTGLQKYHFDSLADAGRYFANGKNYTYYQYSICRVLRGARKTYKNCYWKYLK